MLRQPETTNCAIISNINQILKLGKTHPSSSYKVIELRGCESSSVIPFIPHLKRSGRTSDVTSKYLRLVLHLRARRVTCVFLRVLGRSKRSFKDSVRLTARFYSRSKVRYTKRTTIHIRLGHISVYK